MHELIIFQLDQIFLSKHILTTGLKDMSYLYYFNKSVLWKNTLEGQTTIWVYLVLTITSESWSSFFATTWNGSAHLANIFYRWRSFFKLGSSAITHCNSARIMTTQNSSAKNAQFAIQLCEAFLQFTIVPWGINEVTIFSFNLLIQKWLKFQFASVNRRNHQIAPLDM